jgi:Cellulase (glycosyl hydrolase family 5)
MFIHKNRRALFLIWPVTLCALACLVIYVLYPYINLNLIFNTFPFLSPMRSAPSFYYGENIDMSQVLPASQRYVINSKGQDLIDIAANLGINLVRITNIQPSFNNHADSIYTKEQWDEVLDKMQSKGIRAIILVEVASDNGDYYNPQIQPAYLHLVQDYIDSGVFSNPDVYAVDIKNEPVLTDANLRMMQTAHGMIKAKYPDLKQTVGWWSVSTSSTDPYNPQNYVWSDYAAGQKLANLVDFFSIHMYGFDNKLGSTLGPDMMTKVFVSQVEHGLHTKKPILIEEFGEANGDAVSDQDTIGSPQLQANVYQGVFQALKEMHSSQVIGVMGFDFYNRRTQGFPDSWAILKNNGDYLFPAAYIMQEYALGEKNPALQAATVVSSQSYLADNADNGATKDLQLNDRVGLNLQLDDSKDYSLLLSADGILQPVEIFHYDPIYDTYYAVYQASGQGRVQLSVVSNSPACSIGNICLPPVYTLTINVQ